MKPIGWSSTVKDVVDFLEENADRGVPCPCCRQRVKVYKRRINRGQAEMLIAIARETVRRRIGPDHFPWIHVEHDIIETGKGPARCRDWALLRFWGLIEPMRASDAKKRRNPGDWRITPAGMLAVQFPRSELLASIVHVYNNTKRKESKGRTSLAKALGRPFDFEAEVLRAA